MQEEYLSSLPVEPRIRIGDTKGHFLGRGLVAVVIPTLNEQSGVTSVLRDLDEALIEIPHVNIVVDGNSSDKTVDVVREYGAIVIPQDGTGYGNALKTGFQYAWHDLQATVTVMIDGDCTTTSKAKTPPV